MTKQIVHPNNEIKEMYANNLLGGIPKEVQQHLRECIECFSDMFPEHVSEARAVKIKDDYEPTRIEHGHLMHCAQCRDLTNHFPARCGLVK